jgi:hypothetical protein
VRGPFIKCELVAHGLITAGTEGDKIRWGHGAALGIRDIMAGLEVPDIDYIRTPGSAALGFKRLAKISEPNLLSHSFWDGLAFREDLGH